MSASALSFIVKLTGGNKSSGDMSCSSEAVNLQNSTWQAHRAGGLAIGHSRATQPVSIINSCCPCLVIGHWVSPLGP